MSFDLRNYWPAPVAGKQLLVQDTNGSTGGLSTLHRYVRRGTIGGNPVIRLDEYSPTWVGGWDYRDNGTQIVEVATETPSNYAVYVSGKEIQWGGVQNVNDINQRSLQIDVAASTGISNGYWIYGNQKLTFTDFLSTFTNDGGLTFSNVVKMNVHQAWCANSGCAYPSGQNIWQMDYWLAPGVGIVQIDFLAPTVRRDYATSIITTWETP